MVQSNVALVRVAVRPKLTTFRAIVALAIFGAASAAPLVACATVRSNVAIARPPAAVAVKPAMSDAFVDSIGADSHFSYDNTPYVQNFSTIGPLVAASGLRHLRDADRGTVYAAKMNYLAAHGVRHSLGFNVGDTAATIDTALADFGSQVDFAESANELDLTRSTNPDWVQQLQTLQKLIYHTIRAKPAYNALPVLGPSLADANLYSLLGNLDAVADAGNLHSSTCDYNPGISPYFASIEAGIADASKATPGRPIWTTETAYDSDLAHTCGLSDEVIAKYDPRTVAERWNAGQPKTYFYQLVDVPADAVFGTTGLIEPTGVPKPQFVALESLIGLLADPGPAFVPTPLSFVLAGDTNAVHDTLLQRRDGTYELLVWLEKASWNHDTRAPIAVAPQSVKFELPYRPSQVETFAYDGTWHFTRRVVLGCTPGRRCARARPRPSATSNVFTVQLSVTDTISVVTFK